MRFPFEYIMFIMASVLIAGGLLTAWIGPTGKERSELVPQKRLMIRLSGLIMSMIGVLFLIALLGFP